MTSGLLRASLLELRDARPQYKALQELYNGTYEEYFDSERYRQDLQEAAKRYRINFARTCVDVCLEMTRITGILCDYAPGRDLLNAVMEENDMDFESTTNHENAYTYSDSYIIVLPDETLPSGVAVYIHDPRDVRAYYYPDRPRVMSHAIHTYTMAGTGEDGLTRGELYLCATIYYPDVIEKWVSITPISDASGYTYVDYETVELRLDDEIPAAVQGSIPVFHFDLKRSRLADARGPQVMIDDTLIAMMASIKAAGYRQRYLTSGKKQPDGSGDLLSGAPQVPGQVDETAEVETNKYEQGPDTIMHFAGEGVTVGSFDVTESSNFRSTVNDLLSWLSRVTDTPADYFIPSAAPQSGESRRQGRKPLVAVVNSAKSRLGATWAQLYTYILELKGIKGQFAEPSWAAEDTDDADFVDMQIAKQSLGVPDSVLLVEIGYDQDMQDEWDAKNKAKEAIAAESTVVDTIDPNSNPLDNGTDPNVQV